MKKICVYAFFIIFLTSSFAYAERPVSFNFGLMPGGLLVAPDAEGFKARDVRGSTTISGSMAFAPGAFIGLDFDTGSSGIGIDFFGSYLWSDAVTGDIYGANVSYIFPHNEDNVFEARIKGGVVAGSLDWESNFNDVEFEDASGWQAGIGMDVGRTVKFCAELLYRDLVFDVDTAASDSTNRSQLDLSGGVINLGVKFEF
jgi:hypothetical protein